MGDEQSYKWHVLDPLAEVPSTPRRSPCLALARVSSLLVGLCDYQPTCYFMLYWGLQSRTVIYLTYLTYPFLLAKLFFFVCRRLRAQEFNFPLCTRRVVPVGSCSPPLWSPSWLQPTLLGRRTFYFLMFFCPSLGCRPFPCLP